jgi:hypothetical protein
MGEEELTTQEEAAPNTEVTATPPKFLAYLPNEDGSIAIQVEGMTIEEAFLLSEQGRIKMRQEYEIYVLRTVK